MAGAEQGHRQKRGARIGQVGSPEVGGGRVCIWFGLHRSYSPPPPPEAMLQYVDLGSFVVMTGLCYSLTGFFSSYKK